MFFICGFQLSFSSVVVPRNVISLTLSIITLSIWIFIGVFILLLPNYIKLDLFKFNDNLLLNHIFNLLISVVLSSNISIKLLPEKKDICVISRWQDKTSFITLDTLHMSLIYSLKNFGPISVLFLSSAFLVFCFVNSLYSVFFFLRAFCKPLIIHGHTVYLFFLLY